MTKTSASVTYRKEGKGEGSKGNEEGGQVEGGVRREAACGVHTVHWTFLGDLEVQVQPYLDLVSIHRCVCHQYLDIF